MKKNITFGMIGGALGLVIFSVAWYFFFWRHRPLGTLMAAEYLPEDTVAFVEITDWQRSKARWQETALHKIAAEPEVAAFLAKPESLMPTLDDLDRFRALNPKEVFIAITGQGAGGPKGIAGFDFTGRKQDAQELVKDLKANLMARFPDGKSDIQQFGSSQIETFKHGDVTVGTVFKGQWFFASNDLDLLRGTLDRVDGKVDVKNSLSEDTTYKICVGKHSGSDLVAYANMKGILDGFSMMLEASNADRSGLDELRKIQAISASVKFDGEKLRDALYVYKPGGEARPPLAFNSKAFTSPGTVSYFAVSPHLKKAPALPLNSVPDRTGMVAMLGGMQQALENAGFGFDDFKAAFGPEAASVIDSGGSLIGNWAIVVDVRDRAKAQKFIETMVGGTWQKQEAAGVTYYMSPPSGESMIQILPTLALTDKKLVYGIDFESVKKALENANSGGARIDQSADFQAASALVGKPTDAFAYLDTRAIFEKIYKTTANPLSLMAVSIAFPRITQYVDLSKMPPSDAIGKHLSPIVYSQTTDENGTFCESVGTVTFAELILGAGAGGGIAAFQQIRPNQTEINAFGTGIPGMPSGPGAGQTGTNSGTDSQP